MVGGGSGGVVVRQGVGARGHYGNFPNLQPTNGNKLQAPMLGYLRESNPHTAEV